MSVQTLVVFLLWATVCHADCLWSTIGEKCTENYFNDTGSEFTRCNFPLTCAEGKCAVVTAEDGRSPVGGPCDNNDLECNHEGYCFNNTCVARSKAGEACESFYTCETELNCFNGTCTVPLAVGEACVRDSEGRVNCGSFEWEGYSTGTVCDDGFCKVPSMVSGPCNDTFFCKYSTCDSGTCKGVERGGDCAFDKPCDAGLYCSDDGTCAPQVGEGETCSPKADGMCADGLECNIDKCAELASVKEGGKAESREFCYFPWNYIKDGVCTDINGVQCNSDEDCTGSSALLPYCDCEKKVCVAQKTCAPPFAAATRATTEKFNFRENTRAHFLKATEDAVCCAVRNMEHVDSDGMPQYFKIVFGQDLDCGLPLWKMILIFGGIAACTCCSCAALYHQSAHHKRRQQAKAHAARSLVNEKQPLVQ